MLCCGIQNSCSQLMSCVSFSIDKNVRNPFSAPCNPLNLLYINYIYSHCWFLDTKLVDVYAYFLNDLRIIILITNKNNNNFTYRILCFSDYSFVRLTLLLKKPGNISFLREHHHTALIHGIGIHPSAHESPNWDPPWLQDASHFRFKHKKKYSD